MMGKLILPRYPTAGAGIAITFQGDAPNQGVFWEVVGVDPETGNEGPAVGALKWEQTRTNAASLSINFYSAPGGAAGMIDRIKATVRR